MSALKQKYYKEIVPELIKKFQYKSTMQAPRVEKVVLNVGMKDAHSNPRALEATMEELALITGQRPVKTLARKSIAGFKIRENMILGARVTLRNLRMYEFLERLIHVDLPRVRDFRGLNARAFDGRGNYNMSLKEQIVFPEIDVDKVDSYHGLNITISTTAKTDEEGLALLSLIGMPYKLN
ncbi:MAG: 50S ribosomal protein L5 [Spirochaetales bacterium]|nr:50S ribosomal protein L5 [Spirochaetales bacterium]